MGVRSSSYKLRDVADDWPEFWDQVERVVIDAGSNLSTYRELEHPHVRRVFAFDWELLELLSDELEHAHRFRRVVFDAEDLAYRFAVVGMETASGSIRLIEFDRLL